MHKSYIYKSCFADLINSYIQEKRQAGFMFDNPAYWLYRFDQFCYENHVRDAALTKEIFSQWSKPFINESKTTQNNRLTAVRCFSVYLNSNGITSYIPQVLPKPEKNIPYLMTDSDIVDFFDQVDSYRPNSTVVAFQRLSVEYRVLFRLIYSCGLRNSEACMLKRCNIDINQGILTILHSKGDKDRLVYLSKDMKELIRRYLNWLDKELKESSIWVFPGKYIKKSIPKTSVDRKFNEFWNSTAVSKQTDKKPTVHCLRHAFVIKRMNSWMKEGLDLKDMMPYLSSYLGHKGPMETYYYYHQIEEAFEIIKQKDHSSSIIIPEVKHEYNI